MFASGMPAISKMGSGQRHWSSGHAKVRENKCPLVQHSSARAPALRQVNHCAYNMNEKVGETSRSRQTAFPFTRTLTADYIVKYANKLWDEVSIPMSLKQTSSKSTAMRINNVRFWLERGFLFFRSRENQLAHLRRVPIHTHTARIRVRRP